MGLQHARVVREAGQGVELRALVDASASARELARQKYPDVPLFGSLEEAASAQQIDVVHVCTPQHTHFSVACDALERGCHVFVEKPFVASGSEARELYRIARDRGRSLCAGHQLLHETAYQALVDQIPLLDRVVHVESYFAFAPSRGTASGRAGLDPEDQLMDVLPHPLYLLLDGLKRADPAGAVEVGEIWLGSGTIHAMVRRGTAAGTLIVTLSGRPVASTLRVVGTGGELEADLVRGILLQQIGPGRSAIDKILAPFLLGLQGMLRTTGALLQRILRRQISYPSLTELVVRWYATLHDPAKVAPTPEDDVLAVVDVFESIVSRTGLGTRHAPVALPEGSEARPRVVVTGGTGWLGAEVTRRLVEAGARVVAISRRAPASWERQPDTEYILGDLGEGISLAAYADAACVVHCAAETAGGTSAHERNSIAATRNLVDAMHEAGLGRLIHVSSIAVLSQAFGPVSEDSPMEPDPVACGPYTWGKALSEQLVREAGGVDVKVVRPAAIIDSRAFVPPGKLGKRVGPLFVSVGGKGEVMGVVELEWVARAIAWMALHFDEAPETINLLDPVLPTRRELVARLKAGNPTLWTARIPRPLIAVGGLAVLGLSRVLRPGKAPIDIRKVFARQRFDNSRSRALASKVDDGENGRGERTSDGQRAG
jgi:predicted dehydrogenase/nucleoside-diphosphate-sugar epimerase